MRKNSKHPARRRALALGLALLLLVMPVWAQTPYTGYSYDEWDKAIPSKEGYLPTAVYYGDDELTTRFDAPEDFFVDEDGTVYVLDTGGNRVVVLDKNFHLLRTIETFKLPDGTDHTLYTPKGIYVRDGKMYIADYDNMCVLVSDLNGNVKMQLTKPENSTFPQDSEFRPLRVMADSQGNIYVLVLGVYQGAAVFDPKGTFTDFFGSNTVQPTIDVIISQMWKKLMSKTQQDQLENFVPVQFTSFDITQKDFLYSCTGANVSGSSELRRINPKGENLWAEATQVEGDLEIGQYKTKGYPTTFVDVAVTADDFLFALDSTKGRVFLYDPDGNMVFAFGGKGTQKGTFTQPAAVDTQGDRVLVLDTIKRSITVFEPTEYGKKVGDALRLYIDGDYDGSRALWESVLREDGNLFSAYVGIGKALYYSGEYKASIPYFREGVARGNESRAFKEYRAAILRTAVPYILTGVCVVAAGLVALWLVRRRKAKKSEGRADRRA